MKKPNLERNPVIEGLFTLDPEEPRLIGSKCTSCGTYFFPETVSCSNPVCKEKKVEQAFLSRRGKLWSYTIQYYPPPPFSLLLPISCYQWVGGPQAVVISKGYT